MISPLLLGQYFDIPVRRGDDKITVVYVRDRLHEIPTSNVEAALLAYCGVLSVERSKCADFPTLFDEIRVVKFRLELIFRIFVHWFFSVPCLVLRTTCAVLYLP